MALAGGCGGVACGVELHSKGHVLGSSKTTTQFVCTSHCCVIVTLAVAVAVAVAGTGTGGICTRSPQLQLSLRWKYQIRDRERVCHSLDCIKGQQLLQLLLCDALLS